MSLMLERPTTDGTAPREFEALCAALDELNVPDGYKAEVIRGNIVMSPWSRAYYLTVMDLVCDRLRPHLPDGHRISSSPALYTFPDVERAYGPDIHVAHERTRRSTSHLLDGEGLSLVGELTSTSTRDTDWTDKAEHYSKAGVPVYLLLDMQEESATVLWSPSAKGYAAHFTVPFGDKLHIPAPFDCILDTTGFEAPADREID
ncbi:Uma2 family endonuclease [Streptomyces sp. NA04227]|uniref:Uma2 family endonuclease n=1 Tax=Streptomyces sp. NA04227 TaxID=2742136 RepID=UPI0015918978|nr:Uma2 family endonuclease [Streptomyces sp. NA04227]QKW06463.1 Uma2 family endonuclease [Streptomyces sp. NA04227]